MHCWWHIWWERPVLSVKVRMSMAPRPKGRRVRRWRMLEHLSTLRSPGKLSILRSPGKCINCSKGGGIWTLEHLQISRKISKLFKRGELRSWAGLEQNHEDSRGLRYQGVEKGSRHIWATFQNVSHFLVLVCSLCLHGRYVDVVISQQFLHLFVALSKHFLSRHSSSRIFHKSENSLLHISPS